MYQGLLACNAGDSRHVCFATTPDQKTDMLTIPRTPAAHIFRYYIYMTCGHRHRTLLKMDESKVSSSRARSNVE